jgi:hypothetical protein
MAADACGASLGAHSLPAGPAVQAAGVEG